jgi:hypothetical protein
MTSWPNRPLMSAVTGGGLPAVKRSVSTAKLAGALAAMTRRVDDFADQVGYDAG